ncbi:helix-turn-helix domain-containing protein [Paraburkholderia sp. JHI869]
MRQFAGACRFVYNKALALQKQTHADGGKFIAGFAMKKRFTE